jgi:DtxR family Mn-dependent transcriptional regulator
LSNATKKNAAKKIENEQVQNNGLSETLQNYIETMYEIIIEKNGVRVKDLAKRMKVKNSSVVSALQALKKSGHINYEPYGIISLTNQGNEVAQQLTEKHRVLRHFFEKILGLEPDTADEHACKIEHAMSEEAFKRFTQFVKYIYSNYKKNPKWLDGFKTFYNKNPVSIGCEACIDDYFEDVGGL